MIYIAARHYYAITALTKAVPQQKSQSVVIHGLPMQRVVIPEIAVPSVDTLGLGMVLDK